ncbi:MAG: deoxyribose-phosphate aldolase [bacterium]
MLSLESLAGMIDHTLLRPHATLDDFRKLCDEARRYKFKAVVVNPAMTEFCSELLRGTGVGVGVVVGFPLGQNTTEIKVLETERAIAQGAAEIDFVINLVQLKSGNSKCVEDEMRRIVAASRGAVTKAILETCYLTDDEKVTACELAKAAGVGFVKTSTGFGSGGATVEDVSLMKRTVGEGMGVKASGGIRNYEQALRFIEAGATRLGTSSGVVIMEEAKAAGLK